MLDPETLRTFVSVAETGSFSRAAEKLYKTTATISYRIKLLEDNTGVALFPHNAQRTVDAGRDAPAGASQRVAGVD